MAKTTKQTCGRCGGSGKFSFNMIHGSMCYGCNGAGFVMVDLKAKERKDKAAAVRMEQQKARQEMMVAALDAVISEFNTESIDVTTQLGVEKLNRMVYFKTGKTIFQIRDERVGV